ncbi:MAG: hypothetical protein QXT89_01260 [Candidatus Micrarchaeaceae archaeon]
MTGVAFKHEKDANLLGYMYLKYDISADLAKRIKNAAANSEKDFYYMPNSNSIVILLKGTADYSRSLKIVLPIDKNMESIKYIVENKEKYKMSLVVTEAGNQSSLEISFVLAKSINN